jgi:hypothetical protein
MHHYLSMAKRNFREYLQTEPVRTKKYLYVLRPILACRWIEAALGPVPMEFARLVDAVAPQGPVLEAIRTLTDAKRAGFESDRGPRIQVLNDFLGAEIVRLESLHLRAPRRPPLDEMDRFFRSTLQRAWHE